MLIVHSMLGTVVSIVVAIFFYIPGQSQPNLIQNKPNLINTTPYTPTIKTTHIPGTRTLEDESGEVSDRENIVDDSQNI